MEVHALRQRGWSVSAIARHLERDRKTVRAYLNGEREPGVRRPAVADALAPFEAYLRARFADDAHVWATALYDEVVALGYPLSYPSFVRQVRRRGLRPHCEACRGVKGRETIEIEHPAGAECQWDWFERRRAPWGGTAYVLLGALAHSGRIRGALAESMDQPHLIEAIDAVLRRLGGTPPVWRTDRLTSVIVPGTADVQPSFVPVAKHYGVVIEPCPPRRGNRKGVVEAAVKYCSGRWWKNLQATTMEEGQRSLDRFCSTTADGRFRGEQTVGTLADAEVLRPLPPLPYPATVEVSRPVDDKATVAFRGNRYSVPPGLGGVDMTLRHRLGSATLEIVAPSGRELVSHRLAPEGAGTIVRTPEHRSALEAVVLSSFTTERPCDAKANRPPGPEALAEAAKLLGAEGRDVVVDLSRYAELVEGAAR